MTRVLWAALLRGGIYGVSRTTCHVDAPELSFDGVAKILYILIHVVVCFLFCHSRFVEVKFAVAMIETCVRSRRQHGSLLPGSRARLHSARCRQSMHEGRHCHHLLHIIMAMILKAVPPIKSTCSVKLPFFKALDSPKSYSNGYEMLNTTTINTCEQNLRFVASKHIYNGQHTWWENHESLEFQTSASLLLVSLDPQDWTLSR